MNKLGSRALTGTKYAYVAVFSVLLAGFFYPLITGGDPAPVIFGTLTVFLGVAGVILVLKSAAKKKGVYMWTGFGMVALSLVFILILTGRV